jgi:putative effector of murein hydrolase LrgA (UPF0299 family)
MSLIGRLTLLFCPQAVLIVAVTVFDADNGRDLPLFFILVVSSLLGAVCYSLFEKELHARSFLGYTSVFFW